MALDVDKLHSGLVAYHHSLETQRQVLGDDFREIEGLFAALFHAYDGRMAKELESNWGRTADWFEDYLRKSQSLASHLEERTENLRHL
jgi:hypothetical protein